MKKVLYTFVVILIVFSLYFLIIGNHKKTSEFKVASDAFKNNNYIPIKYTASAENISIPLKLEHTPKDGKTIAIIMDDPDASKTPFIHWMIWNISASIDEIKENILPTSKVEELGGAIQGYNDFKTIGYSGPNPPSGIHNYNIHVYILDIFLDLESNATRTNLEDKMKGHILSEDVLIGKFGYTNK